MQGEVLQSILGLVRDDSACLTIDASGLIKIYHIEDVHDGQFWGDYGYSFDQQGYPVGGYSVTMRCAFPYTAGLI